ncbi:unnamed protein product, partial [Hermetia illucens]
FLISYWKFRSIYCCRLLFSALDKVDEKSSDDRAPSTASVMHIY